MVGPMSDPNNSTPPPRATAAPKKAHRALQGAFEDILAAHAPPEAIARMVAHWAMVREANARQNLTGITEPTEAANLHYLDACIAAKLLRPGSLVDFGTGAGFPGLVFAALTPERTIGLVEPRRLRVAFLRETVAALGWTQVAVYACRVQATPPTRFANATCRAVFAADEDLAAAANWLEPGGQLLSFRAASAPLGRQSGPLQRVHTEPYEVGDRSRRIDVWQLPTT